MPHSNLYHIPMVLDHMRLLAPTSILDIGAGAGWYASIFRGIMEPQPWVVGIEAIPEYVESYRLKSLYDELHIADVRDVDDAMLNSCDVVFMGDVIEHFMVKEGHALINRIKKPIVLATPDHFFQNPDGLPWSETHHSLWTRDMFKSTGRMARFTKAHIGHIVTLSPVSDDGLPDR